MATKAERQRYEDERKRAPKRRPTANSGARNPSKHGERHVTAVTDERSSLRPSRQSTRRRDLKTNHQRDRLVKRRGQV